MVGRVRTGYAATPITERFAALYIPEPNSGCWLWTGAENGKGYGEIAKSRSKPITSHRASWMINRGEIPRGKLVLHTCDNRLCVNPDHLYIGTYIDNRADMLSRGRWKHPFSERKSCSKGHVYAEVGFRMAGDKSRVCRECSRQHSARARRRSAAHRIQCQEIAQ